MMSGHSPIITSSITGDDIMNKVSDPSRIAVVMEGRNVLTTSDNGYTAYEPVAAFFQSAEAEKVAGKMPQSFFYKLRILSRCQGHFCSF